MELLGAPNQVQMRSYGFQYTVVVTPSPEIADFRYPPRLSALLARRLATHWADVLERKKGIADHAFRAQALNDVSQEGFSAARQRIAGEGSGIAPRPQSRRRAEGASAGYGPRRRISPSSFPAYEKQELAMSEFYKDMVQHIDVVKEEARLSQVEFDVQRDPSAPCRPRRRLRRR